MIVLETILALVVVLGILIFIHELGHFLAAKRFGVRVEVFSLGFGPRLFGWKRGDTDYRVAVVPLGGYVRMAGEYDPEVATKDDPGFLTNKARWQRLIIMISGPAMNIALALVLYWGLFMYGAETLDIPEGPPQIEWVEPGSPAEKAGLLVGDRILALGKRPIGSIEEFGEELIFRPNQTVVYRIQRGDQELEKPVTIGVNPQYGVGRDGIRVRIPVLIDSVNPGGPADRAGIKAGDRILEVNGRIPSGTEAISSLIAESRGKPVVLSLLRGAENLALEVVPEGGEGGKPRIGVALTYPRKFVRYGPLKAAGEALETAQRDALRLFRALGALVKREVGLGVMSGPLEIARISRQQAAQGVRPFLLLLAFISLQLGIFNLLPVPVLDGGHILILAVEGVLRRDLSLRLKERVLQAGLVMLVTLAVAVLYLDVRKAMRPPAQAAPAKTETAAPPGK